MSDNKLLKENTVRRFMKLANVHAMTDGFISERYKKLGADDEAQKESVETEEETLEEQAEEDDMAEDPAGDDMEMDDDLLDDDEDEDMEMDAEMDLGDEEEVGAADISLTEEEAELLIDLGERLKEAMAIGDDDDMDDMEDMGDELDDDADMEMDDDTGDDLPGEDEEPGMAMGSDVQYESIDKDEIIKEVLKRVTKRLVASKINK